MSKAPTSGRKRQNWQLWISLLLLFSALGMNPTKSRRALRALEKGNFKKTEALLQAIISKDTLTPAAYYVYARLYSARGYSRYHLETAYSYLLRGIQQWSLIDKEERKKCQKKGFSFDQMILLKARFDSLAFAKAEVASTAAAYSFFLSRYARAAQRPSALRRRDSLAFVEAKAKHISSSYLSFMTQYPSSKEQPEAAKLYEKSRHQESIQTARLQDLRSFLREFPQSVYRSAVEAKLLGVLCLRADPLAFLHFLKQYPTSVHAKKALQLLASIDKKWYGGEYLSRYASYALYSDSLQQAALPLDTLLPVFYRKGYGFMDLSGRLRVSPQYDSVFSTYFCEGLQTHYLRLQHGGVDELRDRSGRLLLRGEINELSSLGADLLAVQLGEKYGLWHLSAGELLEPRYEAIDYLRAGLVRLKLNDKVGVAGLFGEWLLPPEYTEVQQKGGFLIARTSDSVWVGLPDELTVARQAGLPPPLHRFKEIEVIEEKYLLGRKDHKTVCFDSLLQLRFTHSSKDLQHVGSYWISEEPTALHILHPDNQSISSPLLSFDFNSRWLIFQQQDKSYGLLSHSKQVALPSATEPDLRQEAFLADSVLLGYDSLYLVGSSLAVGRTADKQLLYFPNRSPQQTSEKARVYALPVPNTEPIYNFYRVVEDNSSLLLDATGRRISSQLYRHITPLSTEYLIVEEGSGRKGILDKNGDLQVPLLHKTISYPDSTGRVALFSAR